MVPVFRLAIKAPAPSSAWIVTRPVVVALSGTKAYGRSMRQSLSSWRFVASKVRLIRWLNCVWVTAPDVWKKYVPEYGLTEPAAVTALLYDEEPMVVVQPTRLPASKPAFASPVVRLRIVPSDGRVS